MAQELTPKQERFCRYYALDEELWGNATLSYAAAYEIDITPSLNAIGETIRNPNYDKCSSSASDLRRLPKIKARIAQLFNDWMSNENVDMELAKVIRQNHKPEAKISGIREYNKMKKRVVDTVDHKVKVAGRVEHQIIGMQIIDESKNNTIQNTEPEANLSGPVLDRPRD